VKKGQFIYGIVKGKCPRCHEGDFYKYPFTLVPQKITQLHSHCTHCDLKYMMEPSFFYGAMYVNYAITVLISVIMFVFTKVILNLDFLTSIISVIIGVLVLSPLSLRLSRLLWINIFVKFESDVNQNKFPQND